MSLMDKYGQNGKIWTKLSQFCTSIFVYLETTARLYTIPNFALKGSADLPDERCIQSWSLLGRH